MPYQTFNDVSEIEALGHVPAWYRRDLSEYRGFSMVSGDAEGGTSYSLQIVCPDGDYLRDFSSFAPPLPTEVLIHTDRYRRRIDTPRRALIYTDVDLAVAKSLFQVWVDRTLAFELVGV